MGVGEKGLWIVMGVGGERASRLILLNVDEDGGLCRPPCVAQHTHGTVDRRRVLFQWFCLPLQTSPPLNSASMLPPLGRQAILLSVHAHIYLQDDAWRNDHPLFFVCLGLPQITGPGLCHAVAQVDPTSSPPHHPLIPGCTDAVCSLINPPSPTQRHEQP